jgi:capsular polysaccharide transport system permease protein
MARAQAVTRAIGDAARRARFSMRARGAYRGDFELRQGAKAIRIITMVLFVLMIVIPNVTALVYFGLLASDQYVSEAKFTVSSGLIPKMDGMGSVTGVPSAIIIQDTQVVTDYIHSRPMVEQLERLVGLRDHYSGKSIDWWARFRRDKPIEKFVRYWKDMASTSITLPSGIVTFEVRAFSPEDAKRIADTVIRLSENLINDLNNRMWRDTVQAAERDMQDAGKLLIKARLQMENVRNSEAVLEVGQTSKALSGLISGLEGDLLKAEQEYNTQLRYVSEQAPQMRVLKSRIVAIKQQLKNMQAQMTAENDVNAILPASGDKALSEKMTKYSQAQLEEKIAEKRYALSAAAVETARMLSQRRFLYLHQAVAPALPEDAEYPKRWLDIGVIFLASIAAFFAAVGGLSFVRNYMA